MPRLRRSSASTSDFSIEVVPTSTGWPRCWQSMMTLAISSNFSAAVRNTASSSSLRTIVDVGRDGHDLEAVDVAELLGFGRRRTGHAGEVLVEAEVVLEGDRGQRLVLGLDLDVFLGLQRLVQALGIAAARHHAAGELVDDHHFVVADDVVLVLVEHLVGAERRVEVVHHRDVLGAIEDVALVGIALRAGWPRAGGPSSISTPWSVKVTERCFSSCSKSPSPTCWMMVSIWV